VTARIEAFLVNHNTSLFAELALRTFVATHREWLESDRLRFTVVDNHSTDADLAALRAACEESPAEWQVSRWPAAEAPVNSHGDVLRDFVLDHPDASHFLFMDADVFFLSENAAGVMLDELTALPDVWALQGRFEWLETSAGGGASADLWAGRPQQLRASIDGAVAGPFTGRHKARCHPALAFVANTPVFRRVADVVGLTPSVIIAADETIGGFADTFGLASLVMRTHGLRHALSSVTVGHYHGVSYDDPTQPRDGKVADCRRRLAELRGA
jgi:hypothetical protein